MVLPIPRAARTALSHCSQSLLTLSNFNFWSWDIVFVLSSSTRTGIIRWNWEEQEQEEWVFMWCRAEHGGMVWAGRGHVPKGSRERRLQERSLEATE